MGMGYVPVVLRRGGMEDIVRHGLTGFLARDLTELMQFTLQARAAGLHASFCWAAC